MFPTRINILFETQISRDLFKKHAESIIIYPNAISDIVPNFVSVDLSSVLSDSLTAFQGAMVALELANALTQNYERMNPVHEHARGLK